MTSKVYRRILEVSRGNVEMMADMEEKLKGENVVVVRDIGGGDREMVVIEPWVKEWWVLRELLRR